ncbi:glycosyltransferase family 9 protein [Derxia gummosa]|uniref:Glycosyltransferase family 9 protein n=1 Tax=Derxia gummosa DSM 723 TaxID=1121388 RepID=A0A9U5H1F6_9BURK|nr:glycosyltransferase family 9 protein [Derxia gummosa]
MTPDLPARMPPPARAHALPRPPAPPGAGWAAARRILCLRLDNLGDVLMTTPALHALRHALPGRELTLLTSRAAALAAPHLDDVVEVIAHDAPWVAGTGDAAADLALLARLAGRRFDAAVIFTVYSQSPLPAALLCRLAGIPLVLAHCRENPGALLSDWLPEPEPEMLLRHEARRQLDLVAHVAPPLPEGRAQRLRFALRDTDRAEAVTLLAVLGLPPDARFVLAHPGATAASRRYAPADLGVALAGIARATGLRVLIGGSAGERGLAAEVEVAARRALAIADTGGASAVVPVSASATPAAVVLSDAARPGRSPRVRNIAGRLSLGGAAALMARARLLVSNNSAPVHLAAALGVPVVDLYALTNPQHTPWQVPHRLLFSDQPCRHCYRSVCTARRRACLDDITPADITAAALDLLAEAAGPSSAVPRAAPPPARPDPLPLVTGPRRALAQPGSGSPGDPPPC